MTIIPCTLRDANAYVREVHRHHGPVVGAKFAVALADKDKLHGVAIVGRPVARHLDDGFTAEITRVATDGSPNACSTLYGACRRACRAMGYRRVITYTLACEPGCSLRGAGFREAGRVTGRSWSRPGRPRTDKHPTVDKILWEAA